MPASDPHNGERKLAALLAAAKALRARAATELKSTVKAPRKTAVWKSILRVKHDETPRSRALGVLSNVFLHLHPSKINRDAVAYNYTWGMGGMTFYVYITLVFTGTLLMFYYHPSKVVAFRDILYLENDVPFGKLLGNMHRWGAHLMMIMVQLHMFRVFLTGSYKKPREFNWVVGASVGADPAAQLHRIPAARRSTGILGGDGGHEHGARHAPIGARGTLWPAVGHDPFQRRALRPAGRLHRGFQCAFARLHLALRGHPDHCQPVDDRALLASTPRAPTTATHSRCSSLPYLFDLRWVHNPRQRSAQVKQVG